MSDDYEAQRIDVFLKGYTTIAINKHKGAVLAQFPKIPTGKHYGWNIDEALKQSGNINFYRDEPGPIRRMCANQKSDSKSYNTVGCNPAELILLDAGYWGHFDRNKPQRNFGLVQGRNVWICDLVRGTENNQAKLILGRGDAPLALEFILNLEKWGYQCNLLKHASNVHAAKNAALPYDQLTIVLPDMHFPEKWSDIPPEQQRHPEKKARDSLRHDLRVAQSRPSTVKNDLNKLFALPRNEQLRIQAYLQSLEQGQRPNWNQKVEVGRRDTGRKRYYPNPGGMPTEFAVTEPILKTYTFTAEQFLAEKNILDREIALKNSWFYAPSKENPQGDASPAVDLIAMLSAIWELQQKKKKIQVIQVGDLYELWVNREYLYRDWPIDEAGVGSGFALSIIRDYGSAVKGFRGQPDSYQYRFDGDWYEPEGKRIKYVSDIEKGIRGSRCYIFNHWPERNLVDRYSVGQDMVEYHKELNSEIEQQERLYYTKGTKYHDWIEARNKLRSLLRKRKRLNSTVDRIPRVRELVKERIDNVKAFVLPNPDKWASDVLTRVSGNVLGEEKFNTYWRKDPLGKYECLWNKLALDLLSKVDCQMIYGNHDSYRGDKLINTKLGKYEKANMWHSEPGLWAEHGHRWDQYNRDGVVFGAGVTNLVYYYYRPYIESLNKLKSKLLPQFYTEIFPGMVTWYLLANYGDREKWFGSSVKPFGICAIGHTHTPNLLRVRFRL